MHLPLHHLLPLLLLSTLSLTTPSPNVPATPLEKRECVANGCLGAAFETPGLYCGYCDVIIRHYNITWLYHIDAQGNCCTFGEDADCNSSYYNWRHGTGDLETCPI